MDSFPSPPKTSQLQFFSSNIFLVLCEYLAIKDLLSLSLCSKKMFLLIDEYFCCFLKKKHLVTDSLDQIFDRQGNSLGSKGQGKFNLIYKHFFYQELKITMMNNNGKEFDPSNNLNSMNYNGVFSKGFKEFTIGHKFTAFLTYDNVLYYSKTQEFLESKANILVPKPHVKAFTAHRNIVYLTEFGQIFIVFYEKQQKTIDCQEDLILWTLNSPVENFFTSYNFVILLHKDHETHKLEAYAFHLLEFQLNKINEENRLRRISLEKCPGFQGVISCAVGSNVAYFLSLDNTLYVCDLKAIVNDRMSKEPLELQPFNYFKGKQITKISSSFLSSFALEQEKIPHVEQWDNAKVLQWADTIGFTDCVKLLKFYKITGKELATIERKFLAETLGIESEELQNRFLREIEKKKMITYKPAVLYAWGNNSFGQLGCANSNVPTPMRIHLPTIEFDDEIERIEIGWKITALLTKKKKLWISEAVNKSKQPLLIESHHENPPTERNYKRKESDKVRNKEEKKFLVYNSSSNCKSHRWIDVTNFYAKIHKVQHKTIRDVSISKDTFVVMLSSDFFPGEADNSSFIARKNSQKSGDSFKKQKKNKEKIKSANFIVQQLKWNQNLRKNQWSLGVEIQNEFCEISFEEYEEVEELLGFEAIAIRFFKREGQIIWDKNNKIDHF